MKIRMAHLQDQGISFVVFEADARVPTQEERTRLLAQLTTRARLNRMRVDKSALAFTERGVTTFFGTPDLVKYLSNNFLFPQWTHTLTV